MLPLYFLRHADAEPVATGGDSERALTMKGIAQAKRVGEFCARTGIAPAAILYSPYRRTMETAEIVGKHLGIKVTAAKFLASGMRPEAAFDELNARRKSDGENIPAEKKILRLFFAPFAVHLGALCGKDL